MMTSFVDYVSSSNYPFTYPNINDEVTLITNLRSYKEFLGMETGWIHN